MTDISLPSPLLLFTTHTLPISPDILPGSVLLNLAYIIHTIYPRLCPEATQHVACVRKSEAVQSRTQSRDCILACVLGLHFPNKTELLG